MSETQGGPAALICEVFRSPRRADTYLYVQRSEGLARVPEALLERFGEPQSVLTLLLEPTRKLARVNALDVLVAIDDQGFYLQLPPDPPGQPATGRH